jgi:DNA-binding response OmpR family regulator
MDGIEVCTRLRAFSNAYVLMLTARSEEIDRIVGLTIGADDYLAKPFNPHELTARVAAILRRSRGGPGTATEPGAVPGAVVATLSFGGGRLVVDGTSRRFTLRAEDDDGGGGSSGRLTPGELGLLGALARRPGVVLTRDQLLEAVTRRPDEVYDRVVDVHVANLRRKLGDDAAKPWLIETIPQTGYRLVAGRDPR